MHSTLAEMRLLSYRSIPVTVPCVFWKFKVRERRTPLTKNWKWGNCVPLHPMAL